MRLHPHFRYLGDMVLGSKKQWIISFVENMDDESVLDRVLDSLRAEMIKPASKSITEAERQAILQALDEIASGKFVSEAAADADIQPWIS